MTSTDCELITDADVARLMGMSVSWVRSQRDKRKKGLEHALRIDPVYLGNRPRYRMARLINLIRAADDRHTDEQSITT